MIAALELMLKDNKLHLVSASLFPQVSGLVYHWSKTEGYEVLVQLFWDQLMSVILESLSSVYIGGTGQSSSMSAEWLLNRHVELCLCLKNPRHQRCSRGLKVKFFSSEKNLEVEYLEPQSTGDTVWSVSDEHIERCLQTLVQVISVSYVRKMEQFGDPVFLLYLTKLIRAFESREFFLSLLEVDVAEDKQAVCNESLVQLYDSTLHRWLQDEKICSENVVHITFALLKFLTDDEKSHVLEALCKV